MTINYSSKEQIQSNIMTSLFKFEWGAHHPSCNKYDNHFLNIFGKPLCIGCTTMSLGIITGGFLIFLTGIRFWHPFVIFSIGLILWTTAIIQTIIKPEKFLKIILRFLLGVGTAFLLGSVLFISWDVWGIVLKIFSLGLFYYAYNKTLEFRERKAVSPCVTCPEGTFPLCKHKLPRMKQILGENISGDFITNERDQAVIPLLHVLINQFEGGEKIVSFESDFQDDTCEIND